MKLTDLLLLVVVLVATFQTAEAFEVKGEALYTTLCSEGQCQTDPCRDEVIASVNNNWTPGKTFSRGPLH